MELVFPRQQWLRKHATILHYTYVFYFVAVEGSTVCDLCFPSHLHAQPVMTLNLLQEPYWVTSVKVFLLKEFGSSDINFQEVRFCRLSAIKMPELKKILLRNC